MSQCKNCGKPVFHGAYGYVGTVCMCPPGWERETVIQKAIKNMRVQVSEACNCVGPKNGQPRCPCQMRNVIVRDGRYVQIEQDLGPAPVAQQSSDVLSSSNFPTTAKKG